METVIRSPQDGIVKKLAHKEGVSYFPTLLLILQATDYHFTGYLQSRYYFGTV